MAVQMDTQTILNSLIKKAAVARSWLTVTQGINPSAEELALMQGMVGGGVIITDTVADFFNMLEAFNNSPLTQQGHDVLTTPVSFDMVKTAIVNFMSGAPASTRISPGMIKYLRSLAEASTKLKDLVGGGNVASKRRIASIMMQVLGDSVPADFASGTGASIDAGFQNFNNICLQIIMMVNDFDSRSGDARASQAAPAAMGSSAASGSRAAAKASARAATAREEVDFVKDARASFEALPLQKTLVTEVEQITFSKDYRSELHRQASVAIQQMSADCGSNALAASYHLGHADPAVAQVASANEQAKRTAFVADSAAKANFIIRSTTAFQSSQELLQAVLADPVASEEDKLQAAVELDDLSLDVLTLDMEMKKLVSSMVSVAMKWALQVSSDEVTAKEYAKSGIAALSATRRNAKNHLETVVKGFGAVFTEAMEYASSGDCAAATKSRRLTAQKRFQAGKVGKPKSSPKKLPLRLGRQSQFVSSPKKLSEGLTKRCAVPGCPWPFHDTKNHARRMEERKSKNSGGGGSQSASPIKRPRDAPAGP